MRGAKSNALLLREAQCNAACPRVALVQILSFSSSVAEEWPDADFRGLIYGLSADLRRA
jgi:hypothetical protein